MQNPFNFKNSAQAIFKWTGSVIFFFFYSSNILVSFFSFSGLSYSAWPLHSYTQHPSSSQLCLIKNLSRCGRNCLLALRMSHGVWFTDNSSWSRWLSNWKKKEKKTLTATSASMQSQAPPPAWGLQQARVGISVCWAVLESYFLWPGDFFNRCT